MNRYIELDLFWRKTYLLNGYRQSNTAVDEIEKRK